MNWKNGVLSPAGAHRGNLNQSWHLVRPAATMASGPLSPLQSEFGSLGPRLTALLVYIAADPARERMPAIGIAPGNPVVLHPLSLPSAWLDDLDILHDLTDLTPTQSLGPPMFPIVLSSYYAAPGVQITVGSLREGVYLAHQYRPVTRGYRQAIIICDGRGAAHAVLPAPDLSLVDQGVLWSIQVLNDQDLTDLQFGHRFEGVCYPRLLPLPFEA